MSTPLEDLENASYLLKAAESSYLLKSGWVASSSHPGGFWLFEKTFDGKHYCCNKITAIALQQNMEAEVRS